jgi:hypothetical protein
MCHELPWNKTGCHPALPNEVLHASGMLEQRSIPHIKASANGSRLQDE